MASIETARSLTTAQRRKRLAIHVGLIAFGLLMIYPLVWMLSSSVKPNHIIFTDPGLWPTQWTLENYSDGWNLLGVTFGRFFRNSLII
jgi:multiple sugar transport system permease protein